MLIQHAHPVLAIVCKLCHRLYRQIAISIKYIGIIGIYQHFLQLYAVHNYQISVQLGCLNTLPLPSGKR
jgi:hypothetical protein